MTNAKLQSRRQFVVSATTATGGLALGLLMPGFPAFAAPAYKNPAFAGDVADPREVNAWVVIEPDDTVTLRCPMAEMGQGTGTGLPMLLAEELECDWSKVKVEFASVNRNIRENGIYGDQMTAGSRGIRTSWPYVQQAGASARARLIAAAAQKWNVPASECTAAKSKVIHTASGRSLRFGELVADAAKVKLADRARDQDTGTVQIRWDPSAAPGLRRQIRWQRQIRHRYAGEGPALCLDHELSRVRRQTGLGGRQRHQERARYQAGGEAGRRGGGGGRQLLARQRSPEKTESRHGTAARRRAPTAASSRRNIATHSTARWSRPAMTATPRA